MRVRIIVHRALHPQRLTRWEFPVLIAVLRLCSGLNGIANLEIHFSPLGLFFPII